MPVVHQTAGLRVNNLTVCIVDGNLFALFLLTFHVLHVAQCQLWNLVVLVQLQQFPDFPFQFVGINQFVHQLHLDQLVLFCQCHKAVCIGVQRIDRNLTALRYVVQHHLPDTCHISRHLLAVRLTHLVGSHHLRGTLVFAHLAELILHAELSQQVLDEVWR